MSAALPDGQQKSDVFSRSTRSKRVFSAWEIHHVTPTFNFEKAVQQKLDNLYAQELEPRSDTPCEEEEDADVEPPFSSPPTSPHPTPPTSPRTGPTNAAEPPPFDLHDVTPSSMTDLEDARPQTDLDRRKDRRKANRRASRNRKREKAGLAFEKYQIRESVIQRFVQGATKFQCSVNIEDFKVTQGAYEAPRKHSHSKRAIRLDELTGPSSELKFTLLEWDGVKPVLLLGKNRRLIGILAGNPGDSDWPDVAEQAAKALENARGRCEVRDDKDWKRRRGNFTTLSAGISHGGGQRKPTNVQNSAQNAEVVEELNGLRCFRRISGFSTSVVATRAPRLYSYYGKQLGKLYTDDTSLRRPFPSSIFPRVTYNLGPGTVCNKHTDRANLTYGVCTITALGDYDPTSGGHLVLWDYRLVVQFPPGSTILIPSAVCAHSNTPIAKGEKRYSFTQYAAGALFRWVENQCQTTRSYRASLTAEQLEKAKERDQRRWKEGVALLPIIPK